jgi:hypothetical protein
MLELLVFAQLTCLPSHPGGDTRPPGWSWRTIDSRQCWYQGPPMLSKDRLRWVPADVVRKKQQNLPDDFIHPPVELPAPSEFELRWRGEP